MAIGDDELAQLWDQFDGAIEGIRAEPAKTETAKQLLHIQMTRSRFFIFSPVLKEPSLDIA